MSPPASFVSPQAIGLHSLLTHRKFVRTPQPVSASSPTPLPTTATASDTPTSKNNLSRRTLLQAALSTTLSTLLSPFPTSAANPLANPPTTPPAIPTPNPLPVDYIFDPHSGSFIPPSALDHILRRDAGSLYDRCIVAAEIHNNEHTHNAQLAVIDTARRLPDNRTLILGLEQFYRSHNPLLDAYTSGAITLPTLLARTQWDTTWGFDAKLYTPIFEYCRYYGIRMRGLNVPSTLASRIARVGVEGLQAHERRLLPDGMDFNNEAHYKNFVTLILNTHGAHGPINTSILRRFYQVQVLWEEWMSQSVAMSLRANPRARVIALMGAGHVAGRFGFPDRLQRRSNERPYTIIPIPVDWTITDGYAIPDIDAPATGAADLLWYTKTT